MVKPKYPHARIWEERIIDKFKEKYGVAGEWTHDIRLKIKDPPDHTFMSTKEGDLWRIQTAKRVDIVIVKPRVIYVIEVKDRLRPSAIGQALTYKNLYEWQHKPGQEVIPAIVTEYTDPDMLDVARFYGIKIWVV
ncbi:MAG: hypothetical protein KAJ10_05215 [Thermodesulfovibrionia bacterium]|nr:hypothetical protein [Thermodesulfovibrionia bacterium]